MSIRYAGVRRIFSKKTVLAGLACVALVSTLPGIGLAVGPTFTQVCFSNDMSAAMAAADFNRDGKLDIAINPGGSESFPSFAVDRFIDVYFGNGDGTFTGPTRLDAITPYLDMAVADLNNDGNPDLVTCQLAVLMGNGNGTFQPAQVYPGGASAGLAVGDMNGDGFPDVATPAPPNGNGGGDAKYVSVRLNQGNGTLGQGTQYRAGDNIRALAGGDFDGDGIFDIVSLDSGSNHNGVSVLLGKGDGRFREHIDTILPGFPGRGLASADFNRDGKLDLVVPLQDAAGVLVLAGNGNGTFRSPTAYPMPGNTLHVATGDIDGNGKPDIVAGNYLAFFPNHGGTVTILYGDGLGGFASGAPIQVAYALGILVANVNTDSRTDIVADGCVLLNNGSAATAASSRITTAAASATLGSGKATLSPSPLRDTGTLSFDLPRSGLVSIRVYDIRGRRVASVLENAWLPAGPQTMSLNRRQAGLKGGVYFYRIDSGAWTHSGRMVVLDK